MDLKQLFEKIYNGEITKNDVIAVHIKDGEEEYNNYIQNDGFDFWDNNGIKSLNFFKNENTDNYYENYSIITIEEYKEIINNEYKSRKIKELEEQLKKLKQED